MKNNKNAIAIDFGTSRTKLAYYNPKNDRVELMDFGDNRNYLPSYFGLNEGEILLGYEAEHMFKSKNRSDRRRSIGDLKGKLSELNIRIGHRATTSPIELLIKLFKYLKEKVSEHNIFDGAIDIVYLTHPCTFSCAERKILKEAAKGAGFSSYELVEEPIAVSEMVTSSTSDLPTDLIVLDCGAGTLHWTYMHLESGSQENPKYDVEENANSNKLKPGGTELGGRTVDKALVELIKSRLHGRMTEGNRIKDEESEWLLNEVKLRKESYCKRPNLQPDPIKIDEDYSEELTIDDIRSSIKIAYINPACTVLAEYIENVIEKTNGRKPAIVLTGGSSQLIGLKKDLSDRFGLECITVPRFEYAAVLGAIPLNSLGDTDDLSDTDNQLITSDSDEISDSGINGSKLSTSNESGNESSSNQDSQGCSAVLMVILLVIYMLYRMI